MKIDRLERKKKGREREREREERGEIIVPEDAELGRKRHCLVTLLRLSESKRGTEIGNV